MIDDPYVSCLRYLQTQTLDYLNTFSSDSVPNHIKLSVNDVNLSILDLLEVCSSPDKLYFKSNHSQSETLTLGKSKKITGQLNQLEQQFKMMFSGNQDPLDRFYCIQSFQEHNPTKDSVWNEMDEVVFIQPFIELVRHANQTTTLYLHFNDSTSNKHDVCRAFFETLINTIQRRGSIQSLPKLLYYKETPDKKTWKHHLDTVIDNLKQGPLEKVVLARQTKIEFDESVNSIYLLRSCITSEPQCSVFYYEKDSKNVFFSITPEKLFTRTSHDIEVDAIAGTRSNSDTGFHPSDLLSSAKDHFEHELVVQGIIDQLEALSDSVKIKYKHQLVKLSKVQHLKTLISATIKQTTSDYDLIAALHPTAAIGGSPKTLAQEKIASIEPFNRGFYTGLAGCVSPDHSEFLVLIRSCLVQNQTLYFYVGAGIVNKSIPDDEWNELNSKLSNFLEILNVSPVI